MLVTRLRNYWLEILYQSGTETGNDDSGIRATPGVGSGKQAKFLHTLTLLGANITTDETLNVTVEWYQDLGGTGGAIGTTTFAQLSASTLSVVEAWPGDVTFWGSAPSGRDFIPMFPFHKVLWTVGGSTPSMNFTVFSSYLMMEP